MKHLGDITRINGAKVPPVDIITGGSPCQDLSVAGKRAGLAGERSGLFMEQIRIIKEMRENDKANGRTDEHIRPRYMVWENVQGAFSSNKGEDFRCVLEETAKIIDKDAVIPGPPKGKWTHSGCIMGDGWSIAWRLHDAQFWGVPQRRKRISLVADFGGTTAPEILFEREGVSRDIAESREKRQGTATDVEGSIGETIGFNRERCGAVTMNDAMPTLQAAAGESGNNQPMVALSFQERAGKPGGGKGILIQDEHTGASSTLNNQPVCYRKKGHPQNARQGQGWEQTEINDTLNAFDNGESRTPTVVFEPGAASRVGGHVYDNDVASTVRANAGDNQQAVVCIEGNGSRPSHKGNGYVESDTMYTLNSTEHHAICIENHPQDSRVKINEDGKVQTLSSRMGTGGGNVPMVMESSAWDGSQVSPTLTANNDVVQSMEVYHCTTEEDKVQTLKARDYKDPQVVSYGLDRAAYNQGQNAKFNFSVDEELTGPQVARGPGAVCQSVVRRLTPLECERLQGYPDGWTDIGDWIDSKGKKHKGDSDSPRYKALGNSIALPFWQWMAKRMVKYMDEPTMASLFDGIGGFPLSYQEAGVKPIWASEIEEFPIAVTKLRFPDERFHRRRNKNV